MASPSERPSWWSSFVPRSTLVFLVLFVLAAFGSALLVHRAARTPGEPLRPLPLLGALLVVGGAASCAAWGETMRQLALTQLGEPDGPEGI